MERLLFDVKQISFYLSIKEKTIYEKVASGEIPHYKIGRLIRFTKEAVDNWLDSCRNGHKPEAEQPKAKRNRKKSSNLLNNHIDKIATKVIDEEISKYYHTNSGKSDRIEAQEKENDYGSI